MCVLIFCTNLSEIFLLIGRTERGVIKNVYRSACTVPVTVVSSELKLNILDRFSEERSNINTGYSCQIVLKFELSRNTFENYSNTKFHGNPSSGGRVVPRRQADGGT